MGMGGTPALASRRNWWDVAAYVAVAAVSVALLPMPAAAFATVLGLLAVLIARIDLEHFIIPDLAVLAMLIVGLALAYSEAGTGGVADAALRAGAGGALLYLLRSFYRWRTGIEGLGLGDVKLAAAAGPWLMWSTFAFAFSVAAFAALLTVGMHSLLARSRPQWRQEVPFGAFLAPAVWLAFLLERLWWLP